MLSPIQCSCNTSFTTKIPTSMDGLFSIFLFTVVSCHFLLQFMQHTQIISDGGFNLGPSGCEMRRHNLLISKISISSVDLSRTTCMCSFSPEALRARLAAGVAGFDDTCIVMDPHFQILGPQSSSMQLLQEIWHACQVQRDVLNIPKLTHTQ